MTDELMRLAREIVVRYHAHGIRTRVSAASGFDDAILVRREEGWEGPFGSKVLQSVQDEDIDRIEGDARIAAVMALGHEVRR